MKLKMIFEDGEARIVATAEGEFEKRMLGTIVGDGSDEHSVPLGRLCEAFVALESKAHKSYGKVDSATITLRRASDVQREGG